MKPRRFYWYTSLEAQRLDWLRETIETNSVHAAAVASFNDPFEFRFQIDFEATPTKWRTFLGDPANRQQAGLGPTEPITDEVIKRQIRMIQVLPASTWRSIAEEAKKTTVVACFSKVGHNELMWAHYANGHRGVCLEFTQTQRAKSLFAATHQVHYRRELPVIAFPETEYLSAGKRIALTKGENWRYEREYRIVLAGQPRRLPFKPEELTRIIFGARIPQDHRITILGWLQNRPTKTAHAVPRRGRFGVVFSESPG